MQRIVKPEPVIIPPAPEFESTWQILQPSKHLLHGAGPVIVMIHHPGVSYGPLHVLSRTQPHAELHILHRDPLPVGIVVPRRQRLRIPAAGAQRCIEMHAREKNAAQRDVRSCRPVLTRMN